MNINIYIEDALANELKKYTRDLKKSRNAIIREAISNWIKQHQTAKWSKEILAFTGDPAMPRFEATREELLNHVEKDPFA